jgi:hypothetical protein
MVWTPGNSLSSSLTSDYVGVNDDANDYANTNNDASDDVGNYVGANDYASTNDDPTSKMRCMVIV